MPSMVNLAFTKNFQQAAIDFVKNPLGLKTEGPKWEVKGASVKGQLGKIAGPKLEMNITDNLKAELSILSAGAGFESDSKGTMVKLFAKLGEVSIKGTQTIAAADDGNGHNFSIVKTTKYSFQVGYGAEVGVNESGMSAKGAYKVGGGIERGYEPKTK
jgi:hypothetical protein